MLDSTRLGLWLAAFLSLAACATAAKSPSSAGCTDEECSAIAEPPFAPMSCGPGHEKDIGSTCGRGADGQCQKMLTCAGKRPE
jgi:hypothetical protein